MAINGIHTAKDARVVAAELQRLVINFGTALLVFSLGGQDVKVARDILNAVQKYSEELLSAASGKQEGEEVFLPEALVADAEKKVSDFFGGLGK